MPPAARITDMHLCPLVTPGVPPIPHVGGPVVMGSPNVFVCGVPQARVGDQCVCVGPPDAIAMGSPTVLINSMMAARMGDPTVHGGLITTGAPNVLIGVPGAGGMAAPPAPPPVRSIWRKLVDLASKGFDAASDAVRQAAAEIWAKRPLGVDGRLDWLNLSIKSATSTSPKEFSVSNGADLKALDLELGRQHGAFGARVFGTGAAVETVANGSVGSTGASFNLKAAGKLAEVGVEATFGQEGSAVFSKSNTIYSAGSAEASIGGFAGRVGSKTGAAIGATLEAAKHTIEFPEEATVRIPWTSWSLTAQVVASASAGSIGAGGSAKAYHDNSSGRFHAGASGSVAKLLGLGLDVSFSVGPAIPNEPVGSSRQ